MIACIIITDFAVAVERQRNPALCNAPLVLIQYSGQKAKVYAACDVARSMKVKPDIAFNRAVSLCPIAYFISASPSLYRREAQKLIERLLTFTDRIEVEQTSALALWLDLGKLPPHEASQIGSGILQAVSDKTPFFSSVGIADGKFTARIAATKVRNRTPYIVPVGNEVPFLASFPIRHLALKKEMARQLNLLGIETLGQFAALPEGAVLQRFGKVGSHLHRLANGQDTRTITRYVLPLSEHAAHHFDDPVEDRTIFQNVFTHLTCQLAATLRKQGLAAANLTLTLHCENAQHLEASHTPRQPISDDLPLLREVDRLFKGMLLKAGILGIEVHLDQLQSLAPRQLDFFGQLMGETFSITELVKQLSVRHGTEPFHRIVPSSHPGHIPQDQFRVESVEIA